MAKKNKVKAKILGICNEIRCTLVQLFEMAHYWHRGKPNRQHAYHAMARFRRTGRLERFVRNFLNGGHYRTPQSST